MFICCWALITFPVSCNHPAWTRRLNTMYKSIHCLAGCSTFMEKTNYQQEMFVTAGWRKDEMMCQVPWLNAWPPSTRSERWGNDEQTTGSSERRGFALGHHLHPRWRTGRRCGPRGRGEQTGWCEFIIKWLRVIDEQLSGRASVVGTACCERSRGHMSILGMRNGLFSLLMAFIQKQW